MSVQKGRHTQMLVVEGGGNPCSYVLSAKKDGSKLDLDHEHGPTSQLRHHDSSFTIQGIVLTEFSKKLRKLGSCYRH